MTKPERPMRATASSAPPPAPSVASRLSTPQRRLRIIRNRITRDKASYIWISILPVGVSLISLCLSLFSLVNDRQAPDIELTMPIRVRVAQGATAPWLYIQPRFVNTGGNNRNEIIKMISIEVTPLSSGTPAQFFWDEQGTWIYNGQTELLDWQFVADPAPLVVGPNDPQFPLGLFIGPTNVRWAAETYRVTVIATRSLQQDPLRGTIEFTIPPNLLAIVLDPDPRGPFLVELPTSTS